MGSWHWGPPSSFLPNTVYESGSTPSQLRSLVIVNETVVNTTSDVAAALTPTLSLTEAVDIGGISLGCGSYQRCNGKMIQPIATRWRRLAERIESVKSRANPAPTATLRRL